MTTRRARASEATALAELAHAAYATYLDRMGGLRPAPMDADYARSIARDVVWVAEVDGHLAGFVVLVDQPTSTLLENVAVHPDRQGHGVGRRLVALAEEHARATGQDTVELYTHATMAENRRLYSRLGYAEVDREVQDGFDRVFYAKQLTAESVSATATITASAETVFAVLADPTRHAAIDGTGWVTEAVDTMRLTGTGQVFRMAMYHPDHPDGSYQTANQVLVFEPPRAVSWRPGYVSDETGELEFGGWVWRYDLAPLGPDQTDVTLSYDWSAVGEGPREVLAFPPFPPDHLQNSLSHLAQLVAR